jgi:glycosyltransferase involved in cell wall biosynthesis
MMFMPSHREGFGMPVVEAGLVGLPVISTKFPAAIEIGEQDIILFDLEEDPGLVAGRIVTWMEETPTHRLRRRVRQTLSWDAIFRQSIEPFLTINDTKSISS